MEVGKKRYALLPVYSRIYERRMSSAPASNKLSSALNEPGSGTAKTLTEECKGPISRMTSKNFRK